MFFEKKVDTRSRAAMIAFLTRHYRYNTANSWNAGSSYAHCIKIGRLGLTQDQTSRAFHFLGADYWDEIRDPIDDFTVEQDGHYTIGTNGRSSGYLVLYDSHYESTGHKSFCPACGQRNFTEAPGPCGVCKKPRVNFKTPPRRLAVSMNAIDHGEDFTDWTMDALRARVKLVGDFDRACDDIRSNFIDLLECNVVVEETVMVPTKRAVIRPLAAYATS
ncbi:MAG: cysteine protease [Sulfuritalea sp.]|nr:cysteine protease [Sulfuritalea sp.]